MSAARQSVPPQSSVGAPRPMVLLTTDFKPSTGGIAEYLHHLCEGAASETAVSVYSTLPAGTASWQHRYDLQVIASPGPRVIGAMWGDGIPLVRRLNTARYFLRHRRSAERLVRQVVASHGPGADVFVGLWGLESHFWCAALRRAGVPYSLFAYGAEVTAPLYGRLPRWRAEDFATAESIVGCSHGTANVVHRRLALDRVPDVVHPGVTDLDSTAIDRAGVRSALGVEADALLMLTVARLVRRKGVDLVIERVAELARELPALHYVVAGDGPERVRLESLAATLGIGARVHFLGSVDDATRNALYGAADLFVTLNRELDGADFEGFGIVFLEAGLARLPVVGGRNGGVPDAVAHGDTGLLVNPENAAECREALRTLLSDRDRRLEMGRAGRSRALDSFSWESARQRFAHIRRRRADGTR